MAQPEVLPSFFGIDDAGVPEIADNELTFRPLSPVIEIPAGQPISEPEQKEIIYSPTVQRESR